MPAYKEAYISNIDEKTKMLTRKIEVEIENIRIDLAADLNSATVSATRVVKYDWRRSGLPPQSSPVNVSWTVVRTPSGWKIQ